MKSVLCCLLIMMICWGCTEQKEELDHHVFVVNLVNDSTKIQQYLDYHKNIWPEVEAGFRKAGYQQISLYRFSNLVVMEIDVPKGSDLNAMGKLAESHDPQCAEWNKLMNTFQQGVSGTEPGQTWVVAKQFYRFAASK